MRKLYTLAVCLFASMSAAFAQDVDETFQFVKADGTVVPNGSTVTVKDAEITEDLTTGAPRIELKSGLYVKNVSDAISYFKIAYSVNVPNGTVQLCVGGSCSQYPAGTGLHPGDPLVGTKKAGEMEDLLTEWVPEGDGTATVTYQIKRYEFAGMGSFGGVYEPAPDGDGSKVTVIYQYDSAGIDDLKADNKAVSTTYYDLSGRLVDSPRKGLFVKKDKMANGSVKTTKVVLK